MCCDLGWFKDRNVYGTSAVNTHNTHTNTHTHTKCALGYRKRTVCFFLFPGVGPSLVAQRCPSCGQVCLRLFALEHEVLATGNESAQEKSTLGGQVRDNRPTDPAHRSPHLR